MYVVKKKEKLNIICKRFNIGLCYLFGSMKETGRKLLDGSHVSLRDSESDIDMGMVFQDFPIRETRKVYGLLYEELSPLYYPYRLDLVLLQETNFIIQFEAIKGINLYTLDDGFKDSYEEMVMRCAADLRYFDKLYEQELLEAIEDGYFEFEYDANYR